MHHKINLTMKLIVLTILTLTNGLAVADIQTEKTFGNYVVHYSVFNSSFIDTNIAKAYEIVRSKEKVLINIAVIDHRHPEKPIPVKAHIKGYAANLMSQQIKLEFDEIREKKAIYYLANLRVSNHEVFHFTIDIQPDPNKPPFSLNFTRTLYKDK